MRQYLGLKVLSKGFVEVLQASGPYYRCCAARQEENCESNFNKNFLTNLETELLTDSVTYVAGDSTTWESHNLTAKI